MQRYRPSIIEKDSEHCYICGCGGALAVHHVMGGPWRAKSTEDGLIVHLCPKCHTDGPYSAHRCRQTMDRLRQDAQMAYEALYGHERWMRRYGRNYL